MNATRANSLEYRPQDPTSFRPAIGIIGAGGISGMHLRAYKAAGYNVVAICDVVIDRARSRRDEFFPQAEVYTSAEELLARPDIEVVDIATHVDVRPGLVAMALKAKKHVLSQKPFVSDLGAGQDLIDLAVEEHRYLAVNQNGRWSPHFGFLLAAVNSGLIGEVTSADFGVYWAHDLEFKDHPVFSVMDDLILYDFGIHWFDMIARILANDTPTRVSASVRTRPGQVIPVPTTATAVLEFENAQATLLFRGASHFNETGSYRIEGTKGTITHTGHSLGGDMVTVHTEDGTEEVALEGDWAHQGMHGTMGELLRAIESDNLPSNTAAHSLTGLALCFAAVRSARLNEPVDPREIRTLNT